MNKKQFEKLKAVLNVVASSDQTNTANYDPKHDVLLKELRSKTGYVDGLWSAEYKASENEAALSVENTAEQQWIQFLYDSLVAPLYPDKPDDFYCPASLRDITQLLEYYDQLQRLSDGQPIRPPNRDRAVARLSDSPDDLINVHGSQAKFAGYLYRKNVIVIQNRQSDPFIISANMWNSLLATVFSELHRLETDFTCDEVLSAPYYYFSHGKVLGRLERDECLRLALSIFDAVYPYSGFAHNPNKEGNWITDFMNFLLVADHIEVEYWSELEQIAFDKLSWKLSQEPDNLYNELVYFNQYSVKALCEIRGPKLPKPPKLVLGKTPAELRHEIDTEERRHKLNALNAAA